MDLKLYLLNMKEEKEECPQCGHTRAEHFHKVFCYEEENKQ